MLSLFRKGPRPGNVCSVFSVISNITITVVVMFHLNDFELRWSAWQTHKTITVLPIEYIPIQPTAWVLDVRFCQHVFIKVNQCFYPCCM